MGLFSLFKKRKTGGCPPKLHNFLDSADDAYILAFKAKNISPFAKFASREVCVKVLSDIMRDDTRDFGLKRYMSRNWVIQLDDGSKVRVRKEVTHKHLDIGRGVTIPLGDDFTQVWDVSVDGRSQFQIIKIGGYTDGS